MVGFGQSPVYRWIEDKPEYVFQSGESEWQMQND
jgi:hypothetical protein